MKIILKNWYQRHRILPGYLASIFTNRAVIVSACIMLGGLLGLSLASILRIGAFFAWGTITLPYTESPLTIFGLAFFGGVIGLFISEGVAANQWFKNKERTEAEPIVAAITVVIPAETSPVIEAVAKPEPINLDPLAFDPKTGILSFRGKTCKIPFQSKQLALCQKLFEHPDERVTEYDILMLIDEALAIDPMKAGRSIRDAVYAVNAKAKEYLGIDELFIWSKLTVWINEAYAPDFLGG